MLTDYDADDDDQYDDDNKDDDADAELSSTDL